MKTREQKIREANWKKLAPTLIKEFNLNKILNKDQILVDFACGQGVFTNILAKNFQKINFIGYDIDKKELEKGKEWYKRKNLKFDINFPQNYDIILSTFGLHEVKKLELELERIYTNISMGGKIFIYDFRKNSKKKFRELYKNNPDPRKGSFEEEYKEHNKWDLEQFEKIMEKTGFRTLKIKPHKDNFLFYVGEK
jgi:ubiquinone/menaquinone biosynthesis C-methylase UbiE